MAPPAARWKMYLALFLLLAAVAAGYAAWRQLAGGARQEKFQAGEPADAAAPKPKPPPPPSPAGGDEPAAAQAADGGGGGDYAKRRYVITIFDTVLHRKATAAEVSKYAALQDEPTILGAIVRDYDALPSGGAGAGAGAPPQQPQQPQQPPKASPGLSAAAAEPAPRDPSHTSPLADLAEGFGPISGDAQPQPQPAQAQPAQAQQQQQQPAPAPAPAQPQPQLRVCLDRQDVLKRLRAITEEVDQFTQLVAMM